MLQKTLLEFKRTVQTDALWLCPTESMWQGFKSTTTTKSEADNYQSFIIWLYKMISHSTEKIEKQWFSKLICEIYSLPSHLIWEKK